MCACTESSSQHQHSVFAMAPPAELAAGAAVAVEHGRNGVFGGWCPGEFDPNRAMTDAAANPVLAPPPRVGDLLVGVPRAVVIGKLEGQTPWQPAPWEALCSPNEGKGGSQEIDGGSLAPSPFSESRDPPRATRAHRESRALAEPGHGNYRQLGQRSSWAPAKLGWESEKFDYPGR